MKEFEDLIKDVKQEIVTTNISLADRFKKMRSILNSCYENSTSLSEVDINNLTKKFKNQIKLLKQSAL